MKRLNFLPRNTYKVEKRYIIAYTPIVSTENQSSKMESV